MPKIPTLNAVKDIRLRLFLTQEQLAGYLNISRSTVNMIEQGVRELENEKWLRLLELVTMHEHKGKARKAQAFKNSKQQEDEVTRHAKKMLSHAKSCKLKAELHEAKLEQMKTQYQQTISWLQTVEQRLAALPKKYEYEQERKWLEMEQAQAFLKLRRCGELAQGKLRKKVHLLRTEGEINELLQKEMNDNRKT